MEFSPKNWEEINKDDFSKYGINVNFTTPVKRAWKFKNSFIELMEVDPNPNFMRDIVVEYYGLVADKETQAQMGIEPKWLFQYDIEETKATLTVVQSLSNDKIYSASLFFEKSGVNYGLNILSASFPIKEFDYLTSDFASGIEELIKII